jgi:hypothetical protein
MIYYTLWENCHSLPHVLLCLHITLLYKPFNTYIHTYYVCVHASWDYFPTTWFITHITGKWCYQLNMCWCMIRLLFIVNNLLHILPENVHYWLCMCRCLFRLLSHRNDLLHTLQKYESSSLCISWCVFQCCCWLNDSSYSSQEYGWSTPCTGWSSFRVLWKMRGNNISLKPKCSERC